MRDADEGRALRRSPLLLVLGSALVLSAALAVQAIDALRSHQRVTDGALRDYAAIASWQLTRELEARVYPSLEAAALGASVLASGAEATAPVVEGGVLAERFAAGVRRRMAWCACDEAIETLFLLDLRTRAVHVSGRAAAAADTLLASAVAGAVAGRAGGDGARADGQLVVTRDGRRVRAATQGRAGGAVAVPDGSGRWIAYAVAGGARGGATHAYGIVVRRDAYVAAVLRDVVARRALLPATLTRGAPNADVVEIAVSDAAGRELFGRAPSSGALVARDTVRTELGTLVTRLAIRANVADRLIIGGVPRSRLPLLLGTLVVTLLTFGVGIHQMRRQHVLHRMRASFISGVSHELRTPLAQIRLFSELLESDALAEPQRRRSIETIGREAKRLAYLVENVLRFSRSGSAAAAPRVERTDVARLLRDVTDAFRPLAEPRGARLDVEVPEVMFADVDADAISQVLLNLLDNAMKYGAKGQRIVVGGAASPADVRVWVDDEGTGVPDESRDAIWRPYVRLPAHERSAAGGSGIGLAIVREIVIAHGGRCWVETAPGGGARFVVALPSPAAERQAAS